MGVHCKEKRPIVLVSMDIDKLKVIQYDSIYEAWNDGFHKRNIQRCLKGEYKSTDNYRVFERDKFIKKFGEFINEL